MIVVNEVRKRDFVTTAQRFDHARIIGHRDSAYGSSGKPACGGGGGRQGTGARGGGARVEKRLAVSTRDSIPPGLRCVFVHGWPVRVG